MKKELAARRLNEALQNAGITAQELSKKSGVNKSSISQYRNGAHAPGDVSAKKMSKVLNVSHLWLMGLDAPMDSQEPVALEITKYHIGDKETMRDSIIKFVNYANEKDLNRISDYIKGLDQGEEKRMV